MLHNSKQTIPKKPRELAESEILHRATFAHMTADEFHAEQWRQINELLAWNATRAAESEFYRD